MAFQLRAGQPNSRAVELTVAVLREALATAPLLGKKEVLANLAQHHARYVATIDWP